MDKKNYEPCMVTLLFFFTEDIVKTSGFGEAIEKDSAWTENPWYGGEED